MYPGVPSLLDNHLSQQLKADVQSVYLSIHRSLSFSGLFLFFESGLFMPQCILYTYVMFYFQATSTNGSV